MNKYNRQVALFIDVANSRNLDFRQVLRIARRQGELVTAHAYGNFNNSREVEDVAEELFLLGVCLIHCPAWRNGSGRLKSVADELMMSDAVTLAYTHTQAMRVIICSGDGHFIPTVWAIKRQGWEAFVMGDPGKVSKRLIRVADGFIPVLPIGPRGPCPPPALPAPNPALT